MRRKGPLRLGHPYLLILCLEPGWWVDFSWILLAFFFSLKRWYRNLGASIFSKWQTRFLLGHSQHPHPRPACSRQVQSQAFHVSSFDFHVDKFKDRINEPWNVNAYKMVLIIDLTRTHVVFILHRCIDIHCARGQEARCWNVIDDCGIGFSVNMPKSMNFFLVRQIKTCQESGPSNFRFHFEITSHPVVTLVHIPKDSWGADYVWSY